MSLEFKTLLNNTIDKYFNHFFEKRLEQFENFFQECLRNIVDLEYKNLLWNKFKTINNLQQFLEFKESINENTEYNDLLAIIILFIYNDYMDLNNFNKIEKYVVSIYLSTEYEIRYNYFSKRILEVSLSNQIRYDFNDLDNIAFNNKFIDIYNKYLSKRIVTELYLKIPELKEEINCVELLNELNFFPGLFSTFINKCPKKLVENVCIIVLSNLELYYNILVELEVLRKSNILNDKILQVGNIRNLLFSIPDDTYLLKFTKYNENIYKFIKQTKKQILLEKEGIKILENNISKDIINYIINKYI